MCAANTCNTSLTTVIILAANVCVFTQLYAVLYINVHACAHTRHEYMQKCVALYAGLTMRAHVQSPPAGTIITARAHSRQLSPGGP